MKNQKGFSLIELLVVVIIIAIIAAIAIPSLLASRRAANESSAIASLRTIHSAQMTYQATTGNRTNFALTGAALLGDNLIDSVLGAAAPASKSGYDYTIIGVAAAPGAASTYCAHADPTTQGVTGTGVNYYGISSGNGGVVVTNAAASLGCAAGALGVAGTPIQ